MLLALAAASIVLMVQREAERVEGRTALLAAEPSPSDLALVLNDDAWRGEQFPVFWIDPAGGAKPVLPPGVPRLPEPGEALVSPRLNRLASENSTLAARYPDRLVLSPEGTRSGDELLAYMRMPEGRSLSADLAGELSGDTEAVRVRAFGPPTGADTPYALDPFSPMAPVLPVVQAVLAFLVVPGFVVLTAGMSSASGVREHRFEVLRWIGAPRSVLAALSVLETLILAVPGLIAATVLWALAAPRMERVPLIGHDVLRGDLGLPGWLLVAELGACIALTSFAAIAVTVVRSRSGKTRPRPGTGRALITPLRVAPLGVAIVAFVLGRLLGGNSGAMLNLTGILFTVVGIPLVFPGVLRAVGGVLGRLESVPATLAGRGMEWDPLRVARPFLGGAILVILVLVGGGFLTVLRHVDATPPPVRGPQAVFVEWLDPRSDDAARFADALDTGLAIPYKEGGHGHDGQGHDGHEQEGALVVGVACHELVAYFPGTECNPNAPLELPTTTERGLTETLATVAHGPITDIRLVPRHDAESGGSMLVLGDGSLEDLEERTRVAAVTTLPVPVVYSSSTFSMRENPLTAWFIGGTVAAAIALAVSCLISLVDRLLGTRKHRRHLLSLGVSPRRLAALEAWQFAAPYGAVVVVSFSAGLAVCALMIGLSDIPMPWSTVGAVLVAAAIAGLVGTASMAAFGVRSMREEAE